MLSSLILKGIIGQLFHCFLYLPLLSDFLTRSKALWFRIRDEKIIFCGIKASFLDVKQINGNMKLLNHIQIQKMFWWWNDRTKYAKVLTFISINSLWCLLIMSSDIILKTHLYFSFCIEIQTIALVARFFCLCQTFVIKYSVPNFLPAISISVWSKEMSMI